MVVPTRNPIHAKNRDLYMFGGNREIAIQRDGEKCVKCGITREEHIKKHGRDITVDHIDGMGNGVKRNMKNNDLSNLQTLCLPCHASKDTVARKLTDIQVINIRHAKGSISSRKLALLYGVYFTYILALWNQKWRKM